MPNPLYDTDAPVDPHICLEGIADPPQVVPTKLELAIEQIRRELAETEFNSVCGLVAYLKVMAELLESDSTLEPNLDRLIEGMSRQGESRHVRVRAEPAGPSTTKYFSYAYLYHPLRRGNQEYRPRFCEHAFGWRHRPS